MTGQDPHAALGVMVDGVVLAEPSVAGVGIGSVSEGIE